MNKRGVSLVGFLVAVAALSFVLIPFYLAFQTTRTGTVQSLNSLVAAMSPPLSSRDSKPRLTVNSKRS